MENNCEKCKGLEVTLGWSARAQITEKGSGEILASAYLDRLLNAEFYPPENRAEDNLEAWPICPDCGRRLPTQDYKPPAPMLSEVKLAWFFGVLGFLFLVLLLAA